MCIDNDEWMDGNMAPNNNTFEYYRYKLMCNPLPHPYIHLKQETREKERKKGKKLFS